MKHTPLEAILRKRRSSLQQAPRRLSETPLQKQANHQLDQSEMQGLLESVKQGGLPPTDAKVGLLELIRRKCDLTLNKNIVLPRMNVLSFPGLTDLTSRFFQQHQSFFVLEGEIGLYQPRNREFGFETQPREWREQEQQDIGGATFEEFQRSHPGMEAVRKWEVFCGLGPVFGSRVERQAGSRLVGESATLVVIGEIEQVELLYSDGLLFEEKLQMINQFPIFRAMGKKLFSFVNNFKVRNFRFKDLIYSKGDSPDSVFFIVEGNVSFHLSLQPSTSNKLSNASVCTLSQASYFGDLEVLEGLPKRAHTAKVISSSCLTFELSADKFQKLLENPEFQELVQKNARQKKTERLRKTERTKEMLRAREQQGEGGQAPLSKDELEREKSHPKVQTKRRFSTLRGSRNNVKIMHGNLVQEVPVDSQRINFSMLEVNPDHFEATRDKYRQFFVKKPAPVPAEPWNFKKLWRILQLQSVLSENEIEIGNREGKKYFESHRRLRRQVEESRSVRPKTTSSNYRTKVQYIAYLQQFNQ